MYDVRINFNGFTCWYNDLQEFLGSIVWENCQEHLKLYFTSHSKNAVYDFRIIAISHDLKWVELITE
jgi:hypothetical protein